MAGPARFARAPRWPIPGRNRRGVPAAGRRSPRAPAGCIRRPALPPGNRIATASPAGRRDARSPSSRCARRHRARTGNSAALRCHRPGGIPRRFPETVRPRRRRSRIAEIPRSAVCNTSRRCANDAPEYVLWGNSLGRTNTISSTRARAARASARCATVTGLKLPGNTPRRRGCSAAPKELHRDSKNRWTFARFQLVPEHSGSAKTPNSYPQWRGNGDCGVWRYFHPVIRRWRQARQKETCPKKITGAGSEPCARAGLHPGRPIRR